MSRRLTAAAPLALAAVLLVAPIGCRSPEERHRAWHADHGETATDAAATWTRVELYFGQHRRDGSPISDDDWQRFLADEITPRFPAGLTVVPALGQYRDSTGALVREPSRLVVLLYPSEAGGDTGDADERVRAITAVYCERFEQESVLRVESPASVAFDEEKRP